MKDRAIVAFSFGGSKEHGPGASNMRMGEIIDNIRNEKCFVIVQDWIAECITYLPDVTISKHVIEGKFLDSDEVAMQAAVYLKERGVLKILLVAHPFLHRFKCRKLFEALGFEVKNVKTGWVPFDSYSDGWWTRGPLRLLLYTFLRVIPGGGKLLETARKDLIP